MNNENYEQVTLDDKLLNGNKDFLEDGIQLCLDIIGEEIVGIKLPKSTTVEIKRSRCCCKRSNCILIF